MSLYPAQINMTMIIGFGLKVNLSSDPWILFQESSSRCTQLQIINERVNISKKKRVLVVIM